MERDYSSGEVWFVDNKGPYVKAIGGERYVLFFVEYESRRPIAYFRKDKEQWMRDLNSFFKDCNEILGKCIMMIAPRISSSDAGSIFKKEQWKARYAKHGATQQYTAPKKLKQNGRNEVVWRDIQTLARTLLEETRMNSTFL